MGTNQPDGGAGLRVLVADDNPVFRCMLRTMLGKWGYQAVEASDGATAYNLLESADAPRLAVMDWMMPGIDGVEICRRVRAEAREPYIYIVLLTARTESEDLVHGMDAGADDYLTKPFHPQELRVRMRAGRRILELQRELLDAREELRVQATHDGLTGLWNRASILETLDKELARAQREGHPLTMLMIDLDHFKLVNDSHGHQAGDAVLREAARRIQSSIRRYDTAGRYGGEEFVVVLPATDLAGGMVQAERIRQTIAGEGMTASGKLVEVTCSIGVCAWPASRAGDAPVLIHGADEALYEAKRSGRNRVRANGVGAALDRTLVRLDAEINSLG
ncbi:MAG: GGDEF domain-containing protein [Bryobacteraceae bacterium]